MTITALFHRFITLSFCPSLMTAYDDIDHCSVPPILTKPSIAYPELSGSPFRGPIANDPAGARVRIIRGPLLSARIRMGCGSCFLPRDTKVEEGTRLPNKARTSAVAP